MHGHKPISLTVFTKNQSVDQELTRVYFLTHTTLMLTCMQSHMSVAQAQIKNSMPECVFELTTYTTGLHGATTTVDVFTMSDTKE
jgi:hypothetical protein